LVQTGKIACDCTHLGTLGNADGYTITIELELRDTQSGQTIAPCKQYCKYTNATTTVCNNPYQAGSERLEVQAEITSGVTYIYELIVSTQILASSADPAWGGTVTFDLQVDDIQVVFGQ
jgi:hypothetical protein